MSGIKGIKISTPTFSDILPSTGKPIKMKAFRVADEKTLLVASQSENVTQMYDALKEVIGNCVSGYDTELTPYDMEYLFLKLRAISVGETSHVAIGCTECGAKNEMSIDISTIEVKFDSSHTDLIKIDGTLAFKMKYPEPEVLLRLDLNDPSNVLNVVAASVGSIYTEEEQIEVGEQDLPDVVELLGSMTSEQFDKLKTYFDTMPRVRKEVQFICGGCGHDNNMSLEGLSSFF